MALLVPCPNPGCVDGLVQREATDPLLKYGRCTCGTCGGAGKVSAGVAQVKKLADAEQKDEWDYCGCDLLLWDQVNSGGGLQLEKVRTFLLSFKQCQD